MKRYPTVGMRPIARSIREWWSLQPRSWRGGLVMSYPHYLHLHQQLRPDVSVYYNIDDYSLYWPRAADQVRALEREMVRAADLTVCVARKRADDLRSFVPEAAERIHHVPHGAPTSFLAQQPLIGPAPAPADLADLPRPLLGYIGSLEDRVDWELMDRISLTYPHASVIVVGRREPSTNPGGTTAPGSCPAPTCMRGWRGQEDLAAYYQSFDVTLIPYRWITRSTRPAIRPKSWIRWGRAGRLSQQRSPSAASTPSDLMSPRTPTNSSKLSDGPRPTIRRWPRRPAARLRPCQYMPWDRRANTRSDRVGECTGTLTRLPPRSAHPA